MTTTSNASGPLPKKIRLDGERSNQNLKIFNDSVHGHIEVNEACLAIIDTPQFQRLRFIKQLGFCYYVYPGASHNRFEHSIGVYHLASKMVRSLRDRQSNLINIISDVDILCVEIAGLCHDLGHGPHSHMFDGKFIPQVVQSSEWTHEIASLDMFDHLIEENELMEPYGILSKCGLVEKDLDFIKELINGPLGDQQSDWPYKGREKEKAFLYEIVSTKTTGIDVDKWDYFARDCHHLGCVNNFDHNRFIKFARVLNVGDRPQICSRDKEIGNLYQMFYTRYNLHRTAYQHKVACACEIMAVDALKKADEHMLIPGNNGSSYKLSESMKDMVAYMKVTDNILWEIYTSQREELRPAKAIIERLFCRDLYRCVDERSMSPELEEKRKEHKSSVSLMNELRDEMIGLSKTKTPPLPGFDGTHFRLQIVFMDFGKKDKDPLDKMRYYTKCDPNNPIKVSNAGLLKPPQFTDNLLRVYSTDGSQKVCEFIKDCFQELCKRHGMYQTPAWEKEVTRTPEKKPLSLLPAFSAGKGRACMSEDC